MVSEDITGLLAAWEAGDEGAHAALVDRIYPELRMIASQRLSVEHGVVTLQTGDLVQEAYLRLIEPGGVECESRRHFFAIASRVMRRILVDHARRKRAGKRNQGQVALPLDGYEVAVPDRFPDWLLLDQAMRELATVHEDAARVVELRFVTGLSIEETAHALALGRATAVRHLRFARAWLRQFLVGHQDADRPKHLA